jgi:hypothetical protein
VLESAEGIYFMWAAADDMLGTTITLSNLVKSLDDGFELAIPDVDLFNNTKGTFTRGLLSSAFSEQKRHGVTALVLKFPSYMIFGLFVTEHLRKLHIFLDKNSDLACFGEGVFVHAASAKLKCAFVKNALLVYRRHSTNASSTVIPPVLLKNFLKYSRRVFSFYSKSPYSAQDKIKYVILLGAVHIKYILLLLLATSKFYIMSVVKRLGL